jgi:hypothetical protein
MVRQRRPGWGLKRGSGLVEQHSGCPLSLPQPTVTSVIWQSYGQDENIEGIFRERFNAAALPEGAEPEVNAFTTGNQNLPLSPRIGRQLRRLD